jgi:hypothetical protein
MSVTIAAQNSVPILPGGGRRLIAQAANTGRASAVPAAGAPPRH